MSMTALGELGEMLSGYVTHGSLRAGDEFQETFDLLARDVPEEYRQTPATAYRALSLTLDQMSAIFHGEKIKLTARQYGSWTTDIAAARRFLRLRAMKGGPKSGMVVIEKPIPANSCVVDVEALYRGLGWAHPDVDEFDRYVLGEKELILRQDASLLTFGKDDIRLAFMSDDRLLLAPTVGDRIWVLAEERMDEIVSVVRYDLKDDDLEWTVACADGAERTVSWDHRQDCWDGHDLAPAIAP